MKAFRNAWWMMVLAAAGCESEPAPTAQAQSSASQRGMQNAMGLDIDTSGPVGSSTPTSSPPTSTPPPAAPAEPTEQVKADTGVGVKGQSLQEHSGVLVEPAKAYFRVEQKMVFNVQVPQALQLFEASEGRKPNSEQEFMTKIVQANNIKLPTLPQGHKYIYNVEKGELMVERPAK